MVNFMIRQSQNIFGVFIDIGVLFSRRAFKSFNELKLTQFKVIFVLVNHEN